MNQIQVELPMHTGGKSVTETAEELFGDLEAWFRDMNIYIHRLSYGEIPLTGFAAAYTVTVRNGMFELLVYVEDPKVATLAKLRFGGRFI